MSEDMAAPLINAHIKMKTRKSMRAFSLHMGYGPTTLQRAVLHPYPKAEQIISDAIGIPANQIWPSRFNSDGTRKRKKRKSSTEKSKNTLLCENMSESN